MSEESMSVTVLGKTYRIICLNEDRASLLAAAELLESTLNGIKRDMDPPGSEALIAMGALHIAQNLLQCRQQQPDSSGAGSGPNAPASTAPAEDPVPEAPAKRRAKPSDAKPSGAKPSGAKPSDAKPSGAKPSDAKPSDAKPSDAKPSDAKPSDAKPSDASGAGPESAVSRLNTKLDHALADYS